MNNMFEYLITKSAMMQKKAAELEALRPNNKYNGEPGYLPDMRNTAKLLRRLGMNIGSLGKSYTEGYNKQFYGKHVNPFLNGINVKLEERINNGGLNRGGAQVADDYVEQIKGGVKDAWGRVHPEVKRGLFELKNRYWK